MGAGGAKFFYFWKSRNRINGRPALTFYGDAGAQSVRDRTPNPDAFKTPFLIQYPLYGRRPSYLTYHLGSQHSSNKIGSEDPLIDVWGAFDGSSRNRP